jgi:hypothetical protein
MQFGSSISETPGATARKSVGRIEWELWAEKEVDLAKKGGAKNFLFLAIRRDPTT